MAEEGERATALGIDGGEGIESPVDESIETGAIAGICGGLAGRRGGQAVRAGADEQNHENSRKAANERGSSEHVSPRKDFRPAVAEAPPRVHPNAPGY